MKNTESKFWYGLSPWIFIGTVAIFTVIFALITVENINRQKKNSTKLLIEKGAALIRSFEAGTRTGMMGMMGFQSGKFRLQRLLTETSRQPDIQYIIVTNKDGGIVAHSNFELVGQLYPNHVASDSLLNGNILNWRILSKDNKEVFEVFRRFSPEIHHELRKDRKRFLPPESIEWCERMECPELKDPCPHVIYVGFDMTPIEESRKYETRQIVITSLILVAIGVCGMVLLFILQHHQLKEVRELRREIEKNQRLATVGQLAAGVAHEIRNPLSSIKGFATYFKERYHTNVEDSYIADIMIQEVERLNRVVTQLLEFAKPVAIIKKPVCINTLISESLKLIERQTIEKDIHIQFHPLPEPYIIELDSDKINQVLLNLYLNAVDAMDRGGILEVSVIKDKKGAIIRVSDNGCGIKPEDLSRVFDPYFTTKSTGTGLGLAIVNNIIQAHNGKIHIDSDIGKGTTVSIFLP